MGEKVGNNYSRQSFESLADAFQSVLDSGDPNKKTYLVGKKTKEKCEIDGVVRDDITYLSQKNKKHGAAATVYRLSGRRKAEYAEARRFLEELVSYALDKRSGLSSDQISAAQNIQDMLSKSRPKSRIVMTVGDKENLQKILDGVKMRAERFAEAVQEDFRGVDDKLLHFLDDVQEMQRNQKVAPANVRKPENIELLKEIGRVNDQAKSLNKKLPSAADKLKFKRRSFTAIASAGDPKAEEQTVESLLDKIAGWPGSVLQGQLNYLFDSVKPNNDENFRQASKSILLALAEQESTLKLAHDVLINDEFLKTVEAEGDRENLRELGRSAQALVSKFNDHSAPFARLKNLALAGYHWPEETAQQVVVKRAEFFKSLIGSAPTDIVPLPPVNVSPVPGNGKPAPANVAPPPVGMVPLPANVAPPPATTASSPNLAQSTGGGGIGPNVQATQVPTAVPSAKSSTPLNALPLDDPNLPQSNASNLSTPPKSLPPPLPAGSMPPGNKPPLANLAQPVIAQKKPGAYVIEPGVMKRHQQLAPLLSPSLLIPAEPEPLSPLVKVSAGDTPPPANVVGGNENASAPDVLVSNEALGSNPPLVGTALSSATIAPPATTVPSVAGMGVSPNVQSVLASQPEVPDLQPPPVNPVATTVSSGDSLSLPNGLPPADPNLSQPVAGVVPPPTDLPPPPDLQPSVAVDLSSKDSLPPLATGSMIPGSSLPPDSPPPPIPGTLSQAHKDRIDALSDDQIADAMVAMKGKPRVLYATQELPHTGLEVADKKNLDGRIGAFGTKVAAKIAAAAKKIEKQLKEFGDGGSESSQIHVKEFEQRLIDNATRNARVASALSDVAASSSENRLLASERQEKIGLLYEQMLEAATLGPKRAVDEFIVADGGGLQGNSGKKYLRRVSDQFQLNMRAFSPKLPEVGEDLSIADLRNNKLTNKFIAAGKLAATIEVEIPNVFPEFEAETDNFIVKHPEVEFWMTKVQAKEIFAFMPGVAARNSSAVENLFQRIGKEKVFQAAANELVKTIKHQFDMFVFLTRLLTDEEYVRVFPDEIRAQVREFGRSMQELAMEVLNPDAPFLAVYRLAEAALIAPREVMLKLNEATIPLPPTDLPEPLNEGGTGGSAPPNKPQPPLPSLAKTVN